MNICIHTNVTILYKLIDALQQISRNVHRSFTTWHLNNFICSLDNSMFMVGLISGIDGLICCLVFVEVICCYQMVQAARAIFLSRP